VRVKNKLTSLQLENYFEMSDEEVVRKITRYFTLNNFQ
jgi:hypothetical protein